MFVALRLRLLDMFYLHFDTLVNGRLNHYKGHKRR